MAFKPTKEVFLRIGETLWLRSQLYSLPHNIPSFWWNSTTAMLGKKIVRGWGQVLLSLAKKRKTCLKRPRTKTSVEACSNEYSLAKISYTTSNFSRRTVPSIISSTQKSMEKRGTTTPTKKCWMKRWRASCRKKWTKKKTNNGNHSR